MNSNQQQRIDVWTRWEWFWQATFYVAIFVSIGLVLFNNDPNTPTWVVTLLVVLLILWHWLGIKFADKDLNAWEERAKHRFIVIVGDIIFWFALVLISPAFYVILFGLFIQTFRQLPIRYAIPATILLTTATLYEQVTDAGTPFSLANPTIWIFFFVTFASIVLGIWISAVIEQSTQRRQLIEQLEATQTELAAAERREGVLAERQRLAREIHDTLAQGFTSIIMHLEAAEQAQPANPEKWQKHLDQARTTARTSLEQARRVIHDLIPDLLEQQSLPEAIERTATRWQEETAIPINTTTTGNPTPLHPTIEVALLRATQEALNNVRKHAHATAVQITLSYMNDVVILDVQDNGVGLSGASVSPLSSGYGLQAMRERAKQCGGFVTVESDIGDGTTVSITIPIPS